MKSLYETLAVLSTGAALLTGCGGASTPVNAAEVPAATEAKPSGAPAVDANAAAAPAPAAPAAGGAAAAPAAAPAPATPAVAAQGAAPAAPATGAKPSAPAKKKTGAKKTDANASCGAGTCA